ncbi:MAG TPA: ABC transporter permease subunit [Nocardioides sp.]|uniref:ABC transporter permease n=1 Tax=Nocardioides sp. TaxID=35761 RepID=UPI002F3EE50B
MTTGIGGIAGAPDLAAAPTTPETGPSAAARRSRNARYGRWLILLVAAIYFLGPLVAAIAFTLKGDNGGISFAAYGDIFTTSNGQTGLGGALLYSLLIAAVSIVITLALMLPTQLLVHLRLPAWRPLVETLTLLPLVFPPIVLVVGVSDVYAWAAPPTNAAAGTQESFVFHILKFLREDSHPLLLALLYVILAMPFTFRALDSGIRAIDAQTLVEAARNLGAGWSTVLFRVLMPCLRTALVNAAFLCFALVMGEFTISSVLLYTKPFPVWLAQLPTTSGQVQAAVSVFSLLLVEVILLVLGALNVRGPAGRKE